MEVTKSLQLKPERVFYHFEQIAGIPHGSYHTKQISDYIAAFARNLQLEVRQDEFDNLIIIKEATSGYENSPAVMIQGHIDMVCEKEADCLIDFEKDGLDLYVEDGYLRARGTTLGGDDGIAVAFAMALLESSEYQHPRLEIILTTNEEVGLLGAKQIDLSGLEGHLLLNIDSDIEGHFLTSCAGGITAENRLPVSRITMDGILCEVRVSGLQGGHSGSEIDKERCNGIHMMGRVLKHLAETAPFGLVELYGGLKDNAIPRDVCAVISAAPENVTSLEQSILELQKTLTNEYQSTDSGITVTLERTQSKTAEVLDQRSFAKILFFLRNLPNGVVHMSGHDHGLVETSLNSGIMKLTETELMLTCSIRSSVASRKAEVLDKVTFLTEFLGGSVDTHGDYTAWEYRSNSPLREKVKEIYTQVAGEEPVFEAIHAGLECGILAAKITDMDAISFGPENLDIHTPKERLNIESTARVWEFLIALLAGLK